ncbi:hypothetical protein [Embleya sp. NPDC001921]
MTDWPYDLTDPVLAVHLALEPDCPYDRPETCPRHTEIRRVIATYQTWSARHEAGTPPTTQRPDQPNHHTTETR